MKKDFLEDKLQDNIISGQKKMFLFFGKMEDDLSFNENAKQKILILSKSKKKTYHFW